jgi:hypothetical protein
MSACSIVVQEASSVGRSYRVTSMTMSAVRPAERTADLNVVPALMGPAVTFSARTMLGLYCGSLDWSAT